MLRVQTDTYTLAIYIASQRPSPPNQMPPAKRRRGAPPHLKSRRRMVDLPLPVDPTSATVEPPGMEKLTWRSTGAPSAYCEQAAQARCTAGGGTIRGEVSQGRH